jgi:hypothetical protein
MYATDSPNPTPTQPNKRNQITQYAVSPLPSLFPSSIVSHARTSLRRRMRKQETHTLPIMRPPNRLRQRGADIHNPQPLAPLPLIPQRHRIRNHDSAQLTPVQRLDRISAQNPMCDDGDDLASLVRHDGLGSFDERAACVGHVVDEDGDLVLDVADENHA